jgi:hypothetical protein
MSRRRRTRKVEPDGFRAPLKTLISAAATVPVLPRLAEEMRAHRSVLRAVYVAGDAAGLNGDAASRSACATSATRSLPSRACPGSRCRRLLRLRATPIRE